MMFPKPVRKKDRALLNSYHSMYCVQCGRYGCDPAHIKSVGSGEDDEPWNVMPLCRIHHSEQHKIGWVTFATKYPRVMIYLLSHGWVVENFKLRRNE